MAITALQDVSALVRDYDVPLSQLTIGAVRTDGSTPLTSAWNAGLFNIFSENSLGSPNAFSFLNVAAFKTGGNGTIGNPYTGWDTAINWTIGGRIWYFPAAFYSLSAGVTITSSSSFLVGDTQGEAFGSVIQWAGAAGTVFTFSNGASTLSFCGVSKLSFVAANTTNTKIMVNFKDCSGMYVEQMESNTGSWTGSNSIGIKVNGREHFHMRNSQIYADLPIQLDVNPNFANTLDLGTIRDTTLVSSATHRAIEVVDNANTSLSNFYLENCDAALGLGLMYMNTTLAASTTALNVGINNCRAEQFAAGSGYLAEFNNTTSMFNISVSNSSTGGANANGLKFVNCINTVIKGFFFNVAGNISFNIQNGSGGDATLIGCNSTAGSAVNFTGNRPLIIGGSIAGVPYSLTAKTEVLEVLGRIKSRQTTVPSIGTISAGIGASGTVACVAGSTDQAGTILLTYNGAGIAANVSFVMTFGAAYAAAPSVVLTGAAGNTSLTAPVTLVCGVINTGNVTIALTNGGVPAGGNTFIISYWVIPSST